jgi:DNA-binding MarR family transcriptional regulator
MSELDVSRVKLCVAGNLRRTTRALTQLYDDALRPSGMRVTQFSVLVHLARLGTLSMNQLAEQLVMDRTTLTRNLQPLEKRGWVASQKGDDQRARLVTLTKQGERALTRAIPLWEETQTHIINSMGQERFRALINDLADLVKLTH